MKRSGSSPGETLSLEKRRLVESASTSSFAECESIVERRLRLAALSASEPSLRCTFVAAFDVDTLALLSLSVVEADVRRRARGRRGQRSAGANPAAADRAARRRAARATRARQPDADASVRSIRTCVLSRRGECMWRSSGKVFAGRVSGGSTRLSRHSFTFPLYDLYSLTIRAPSATCAITLTVCSAGGDCALEPPRRDGAAGGRARALRRGPPINVRPSHAGRGGAGRNRSARWAWEGHKAYYSDARVRLWGDRMPSFL
jgi:hypothetical protein